MHGQRQKLSTVKGLNLYELVIGIFLSMPYDDLRMKSEHQILLIECHVSTGNNDNTANRSGVWQLKNRRREIVYSHLQSHLQFPIAFCCSSVTVYISVFPEYY